MWDDLSPVQEVLLEMWRDYYPTLYWANRINKINPLNPHDELEAIFALLQLSDTYVHNLVANVKNLNEPWYFVKERAYKGDINDFIDTFTSAESDRFDLRNYEKDLEDITSFTPQEGWEVLAPSGSWEARPLDVFAWAILGCPGRQNHEANQLVFQDDPGQYIEVCNGVVNFRENWKPLLNDLKHGFRLLPFEWEAMEGIESISASHAPDFDYDEKKEEYENTKEDYVYFWRLVGEAEQATEQPEVAPERLAAGDFGLFVYRIDINVCLGLARTMNLLLHNLITTEPVPIVEELESLVDESGQVDTFEEFIPITMLEET